MFYITYVYWTHNVHNVHPIALIALTFFILQKCNEIEMKYKKVNFNLDLTRTFIFKIIRYKTKQIMLCGTSVEIAQIKRKRNSFYHLASILIYANQ